MGRGDRRSRRSKIWRGTFGKSRPSNQRKRRRRRLKRQQKKAE
ncbi:MAG TPA: 30S ribosomal protein THX [Bacteroidota bacterium]|nr:30S ribosomal protein THX [Bacteroidota bacterium]